MNKNQRMVVITAFIAVVVTGIFPPWHIKQENRSISTGYWFITDPPVKTNSYGYKFSSEINVQTLLVQWGVISAVGACLYMFFNKND